MNLRISIDKKGAYVAECGDFHEASSTAEGLREAIYQAVEFDAPESLDFDDVDDISGSGYGNYQVGITLGGKELESKNAWQLCGWLAPGANQDLDGSGLVLWGDNQTGGWSQCGGDGQASGAGDVVDAVRATIRAVVPDEQESWTDEQVDARDALIDVLNEDLDDHQMAVLGWDEIPAPDVLTPTNEDIWSVVDSSDGPVQVVKILGTAVLVAEEDYRPNPSDDEIRDFVDRYAAPELAAELEAERDIMGEQEC